MQVSTTAIKSNDHSWFRKEVSAAKNRILLLDYDGTVAPFSADRQRALPYPEVPALLRTVMNSCATRLIIVSGRSAHEVVTLLGFTPRPEIWGANGIERLHSDGHHEETRVSEAALQVLAQAEARLDRAGLGQHIEVKLAGVAVHWRGLSATEVLNIRTKTYRILEPLAAQPDLLLAEFKEGVEIRLCCANKGNALRILLRELDDNVPVAYLGDDTSDEDAFRVLNGRGLSVLVSSKSRFTAAHTWVRPPEELTQFLIDWI